MESDLRSIQSQSPIPHTIQRVEERDHFIPLILLSLSSLLSAFPSLSHGNANQKAMGSGVQIVTIGYSRPEKTFGLGFSCRRSRFDDDCSRGFHGNSHFPNFMTVFSVEIEVILYPHEL